MSPICRKSCVFTDSSVFSALVYIEPILSILNSACQFISVYMVINFNAQPFRFDVHKAFLFRDGGGVGGVLFRTYSIDVKKDQNWHAEFRIDKIGSMLTQKVQNWPMHKKMNCQWKHSFFDKLGSNKFQNWQFRFRINKKVSIQSLSMY